jgi:hypothetical protein
MDKFEKMKELFVPIKDLLVIRDNVAYVIVDSVNDNITFSCFIYGIEPYNITFVFPLNELLCVLDNEKQNFTK